MFMLAKALSYARKVYVYVRNMIWVVKKQAIW